jgi:long-chain acyl-CoA synthetase
MAVSTAMKLPENIASEFNKKFGIELAEAYGIIEVGLPFIKFPSERDRRGSVGRPLPGYEIELRNKDADGVGEIYLKGKGMLEAYFSPWRGRDLILADGWFRTGDLGSMDGDGFLTIRGRDKDMINFMGMKVFAPEVETVVNQYPLIKESLVYGASHPHYGQLPMAKVVLKEGVASVPDLNDLRKFCYQRLASYKVPKDFEVVDHITKTASGKIKR